MFEGKKEKFFFQFQLFCAVGPFFSIIALLVFYLHFGSLFYYPFGITLVGFLLALFFKGWGWVATMCTLVSLTVFHYSEVPLASRLWFLGITLCIALSQLITWLSIKEMEELIDHLFKKSRSRLDNLWAIDKKYEALKQEHQLQLQEVIQLKRQLHQYQEMVKRRRD